MEANNVLDFLTKNRKFKYSSFNYKMAVNDFRLSEPFEYDVHFSYSSNSIYTRDNVKYDGYIPEKYKTKHFEYKTGKLRSICFKPNGDISHFYIGNKWSKRFYPSDININVIPDYD